MSVHECEFEYDYEALAPNSPVYLHLAAGAAAGILEHTVVYPLDSIKTRMQVVGVKRRFVYSTIAESYRYISTTEGFRALWRGISSMAIGAGPSHALHFAAYEQVKHVLSAGADDSLLKPLAAGIAGGVGTAISDVVMNPFDVVKQRMQADAVLYRNLTDCARTIFRTEGLRAFFVSYPTTLLMNLPFQSIQFGLYDLFKSSANPSNSYSPLVHVVSGALSGAIAAALTTPIDCAKTLLQTRGISPDSAIQSTSGIFKALNLIVAKYGVRGLFRGMSPRIISVMPSTAICWTTYEYFKYLFSN